MLHHAASKGDLKVARFLVDDRGADPFIMDEVGARSFQLL